MTAPTAKGKAASQHVAEATGRAYVVDTLLGVVAIEKQTAIGSG